MIVSENTLTIATVCVIAFAFIYSLTRGITKSRNPLIRRAIAGYKRIIFLLFRSKKSLRGQIDDSFFDRVFEIAWPNLQTAYGPAYDVPFQLVEIAQSQTNGDAIGDLSNHLCHQGGFVTSASAAATPFLLEAVRDGDPELAADVMNNFLGSFAYCTNPHNASNVDRTEFQDFETSIYELLSESRPLFEKHANSQDEDLSVSARYVLGELAQTHTAT